MATTEEVYNQEREIPATVTSISLNVSDLEGIVEKLEKALEPVMANVDTVHGDVAEVPSKTSLGGSLSSANSRLLRAKFRLMEILGNLEV